MLHGNGSGNVETEAYESAEASFLKKKKYFRSVLEARFRKLPQDSDSGSEAGSGRPLKLPCNVG
ncbi:hypothetical protein YC2023_045124 [Brassica napus]